MMRMRMRVRDVSSRPRSPRSGGAGAATAAAGGFRVTVSPAISCVIATALLAVALLPFLLVGMVAPEGGTVEDGSRSIVGKSNRLREENEGDKEQRVRIAPVRMGDAKFGDGGARRSDKAGAPRKLVEEVASLWHGSAPVEDEAALEGDRNTNITLVLTHCDMDLGWLPKYASRVRVRRLVVISKCGFDIRARGEAVRVEDLLPDVDESELERLPNVGRCDHAMADYMDRIASSSALPRDDVVVFLKDSLDAQRSSMETRPLHEGVRIARSRGFGCLRHPGSSRADALSSLHLTEKMTKLFKRKEYNGLVRSNNDNTAFESRYENMAAWLKELGLTLPLPFTPVCYGGMFAVTMDRILSVPPARFVAIRDSLARGNNIEESHYAERTWEGLLSDPPEEDLARLAAALATHVYVPPRWKSSWRLGTLARDCGGHYKLSLKEAGDWAGCPGVLTEMSQHQGKAQSGPLQEGA